MSDPPNQQTRTAVNMPPWQLTNAMKIFRLRVLLRATKEIPALPTYHGAVLYATLAEANARATGEEPAIPDGLLLDSPEQLITSLQPDEQYAFGFTLLAPSRQQAVHRCQEIVRGLRIVGCKKPKRGAKLGGNFQVESLEDLVAGAKVHAKTPQLVEFIPPTAVEAECAAIDEHQTLTLRFLSPLRAHRPKPDRRPGQTYFSRDYFNPHAFVSRIMRRLRSLGILAATGGNATVDGELEVLRNEMVWLDLKYGYRGDNQSLDGALGKVVLRVPSQEIRHLLVWGQYTRIGESTRFGHGRYRIEDLGDEPYPCRRARGLLQRAFHSATLDRAAEQYNLPSGTATQAAWSLLAGKFQPAEHTRVTIESSDGKPRELSIPSRLDRALQRAVLEQLAPPLNSLLEDSSFAYRPGLSRERAAGRIRRAWRQGFRWAVRSDILRFFDSVDHGELHARLSAYIGDDQMVAAIMMWIRAGAPSDDCGLPTGASLSPLLGNLLLDHFDEQIHQAGGYLVRYGDDFLILYRGRKQALQAFEQAAAVARDLQLKLNSEKSHLVDLSQPFDYLGFRFQRQQRWQFVEPSAPCLLDDLGWRDASRPETNGRKGWKLAGESDTPLDNRRSTVIVGPGCRDLHVDFDELRAFYTDARPFSRIPLERVCDLIVLGTANLSADTIKELSERGCHVLFANDSGRFHSVLSGEVPLEDAEAVTCQVRVSEDERRRLMISKRLVVAKMHNYAALASAAPIDKPEHSPEPRIKELIGKAQTADTIESLRGLEGAAAAAWYASFQSYLKHGFRFERRVAPAATDPVNVLLNIGYTALYRYLILMIRQVGLLPSLGFLHASRAGHATLTSDLQEPFRHLVDRAVIVATSELRPRDFHQSRYGPFKLRILPHASRRFQSILHRGFARPCTARAQSNPRAYRWHWLAAVRSLKRHLKDGGDFSVFEHP